MWVFLFGWFFFEGGERFNLKSFLPSLNKAVASLQVYFILLRVLFITITQSSLGHIFKLLIVTER